MADEVRAIADIWNRSYGLIGIHDAALHFANSDLESRGKRGWEAVLRYKYKGGPFPWAVIHPTDDELPLSISDVRRFFLHHPDGHRVYVCIVDDQRRPFDFTTNCFKPASQLSCLGDACLYAIGAYESRADHEYSYRVEVDLGRLLAGAIPRRCPPTVPRLVFIGSFRPVMNPTSRSIVKCSIVGFG